jgi:two-component system chemotaxis response regulator CheY
MVYRVLIVDDAGFIREIIAHVCKDFGCDMIFESDSADQAIALANKIKPHLIFLDLVMPVKNGLETAKEILNSNATLKIIAVSTVDQEFLKKQALEIGCKEFLAKPFSKKNIMDLLEKYKPFNMEVESV